MAEIKACKCKHEYQDNKYGKGKRVHNNGPKEEQNREAKSDPFA